MQRIYDLAIIGGGINGCGIARDAAGRGYSVFLCEMSDLASGTSSRSTKLIHGGLRYLEQLDFRLVREALTEREVLWRIAPHIVRPMRFVLPYRAGLRPAWMLRLGLFLYDHLGGRKRLPGTRVLDLATDAAGRPLQPGTFTTAFEYSDCWVDDARLVVLNARDAADRGAVIRTRTKVVSAERRPDGWRAGARGCRDGAKRNNRGAYARQCRRAVGRGGAAHARRRHGAGACAPRGGLAHRHAQALRPRPRLHLPERRRPRGVRHPLRAGPDADRHDRARLRRRSRSDRRHNRRGRLSVRRGQCRVRALNHAGGRGLDLFRRAPAVRRRGERSQDRLARLCAGDECRGGGRTGAVDHRRQDHDLP